MKAVLICAFALVFSTNSFAGNVFDVRFFEPVLKLPHVAELPVQATMAQQDIWLTDFSEFPQPFARCGGVFSHALDQYSYSDVGSLRRASSRQTHLQSVLGILPNRTFVFQLAAVPARFQYWLDDDGLARARPENGL